jgi:hypothetical protein
MNSRIANAMLRELMEIKLAGLPRPPGLPSDIITSTLAAARKKKLDPTLYAGITDRPARAASMPTHITGSGGAHPGVGGGGGLIIQR